ncbi:MAG: helix-turn-helix domain-containing protein, partial [Deltaproteobacteria bacterium]|nr:helix-turn-helix domain-containing protein [Deltaproteobacteria bacterium]
AAKPVRLMAHLIRLFVPRGGRLIDPFCGGGATGVAAALTGRRAILIERDPGFSAMARRAMAAVHGRELGITHRIIKKSQNTATPHSVKDMSDNEVLRHHESLPQDVATTTPALPHALPAGPPGPADAQAMVGHLGGNVAARTLLRWARSGHIPAVKIGRSWMFVPADVVAALTKPSCTKEVVDVHPADKPRPVRGPDLSLRPPRGSSAPAMRSGRRHRRREEEGEGLPVRGKRMDGQAQAHKAGAGEGDRGDHALDPAQRERIRRLLGTDLLAVGQEQSRPQHDARPCAVPDDLGRGPGEHPAPPDRKPDR